MSFPATWLLDTFDRADGAINYLWGGAALGDSFVPTVESNLLRFPAGGQASVTWDEFSQANVELYCTISTLNAAGGFIKLLARMDTSTSGATTAYIIEVVQSSGDWRLKKRVASVETTVATFTALQTVAAGDSIGARFVGTTIELWHKPSAGSWTLKQTTTDASITTAGYIGIGSGSGATPEPRINNFGGGATTNDTFPTTPILDTFTGSGALSGSWSPVPAYAGDSTPVRFNDVVVGPASQYSSAVWGTTFAADSEAYLTIPSVSTDTQLGVIWLGIKDPDGAAACSYPWIWRVDTQLFALNRQHGGGADVGITGDIPLTFAVGDRIGIRKRNVGGDINIEMWRDSGSGFQLKWVHIDIGAVATYPDLASAGGKIGFANYTRGNTDVLRSIDDFGGGTYTPTVPPSGPALITPMRMM